MKTKHRLWQLMVLFMMTVLCAFQVAAEDEVATPIFTVTGACNVILGWGGYSFEDSCLVKATCETPGAIIRYCIDGYPTENSPVFPPGGLTITEEDVYEEDVYIIVRAYKDGKVSDDNYISLNKTLTRVPEAQAIVNHGEVTFFTSGPGSEPWFLQDKNRHTVPTAMQSGITQFAGCSALIAKVVGPGTFSFWCKTSSSVSEKNDMYITADEESLGNLLGTTEWTKKTYTFEGDGDHYVVWSFVGDILEPSDDDYGVVDDVNWESELEVAEPVLSVTGACKFEGKYHHNGSCLVTATCETPGATIRYTLTGFPDENSPEFPPEGLTITGEASVTAQAFKDGMQRSRFDVVWIDSDLKSIPEAQSIVTQGDVSMFKVRYADESWFLQETNYHSSPSAMQSGLTEEYAESALIAKVVGSGKLSFWWKKTSSPTDTNYLSFYIDDKRQGSEIHGDLEWTQMTYTIIGDGEHYLLWTYYRGALNDGGDNGFLDDVSWTPIQTPVLERIAIVGSSTIATASTKNYTCNAMWSDGTGTFITPTWTVTPANYASVDADGVVTNTNMTTTDKTVTLKAVYMTGGVTKEATKTITMAKKTPVSISISGPDTISANTTATYHAWVTWSYGSSSMVTSPTWSLFSYDYASLEGNGVVKNNNTTPRPLSDTLTVTHVVDNQQLTASKLIKLTPPSTPSLVSIAISGPASIQFGSSAAYTCTATWSDQTTSTVTPIWTVSVTKIATVDENGVVTNNSTSQEDRVIRLNALYEENGVMKLITKSITLQGGVIVPNSQTLALQPGWNWVSFNFLPSNHKVGNVLGTAGFTANDIIQTDGDSARFTGDRWISEDFLIEFGKLYQIYVANAVTVEFTGEPSGQHSVSLGNGWNWVGNPMTTPVLPADVSHSGGWVAGDRIQTGGGVSAIYTADGNWVPADFALEPGKGYQIYAANAGMLTFPDDMLYAVVDLSGGPNAARYPVRYSATGPDLNDDTCRTTELWLRKITAGTFIMGAPADEVGRDDVIEMPQHEVTLTKDYYIGVFECTQKQWELVMGDNPSYFNNTAYYSTRPVENYMADRIRGSSKSAGGGWPVAGHAVDADSFMGKLRQKTGLTFDLPTEAQWEYACRAGTTTAFNSGKNLTYGGFDEEDAAMNEVGRYRFNGGGTFTDTLQDCTTDNGTAKVGSYLPNAWGLYDMHGNVTERCLDQYWGSGNEPSSMSAETDPVGPSIGSWYHIYRGGDWKASARSCRSAHRNYSFLSSYGTGHGFRITIQPKQDLYVVVDLSGGPNASSYPVRYSSMGPDLSDDTCRTTELWLRKIPAGTFIMGSPEDELSHGIDETQHQATLTQDFYIGVFECTQRQWELVMGDRPSFFNNAAYYATRPVEKVSYDMIRGVFETAGAGWPTYGHTVDATSFMGKLQAKTGLTFDLPTEAQWEYACRAGTTTALNSGDDLTSTEQDDNLDKLARYYHTNSLSSAYQQDCTTDGGTAKVGSYLPNAWGLYDMHGNIFEWCLDWFDFFDTAAVSDPVGAVRAASYEGRVIRGGYYTGQAHSCRSAERISLYSSNTPSQVGFRIACHPQPPRDLYAVVDLSGGPNALSYPVRYSSTAPDVSDDTCRTTELWLRKIPKGSFIMGSPNDENGKPEDYQGVDYERQHNVTLTQDYYIGVFECTQKQWELVMGTKPSHFNNAAYYATRPVECVSYGMIRGTTETAGTGWPEYGHVVDSTSFMGVLRAKTGLMFDLPTEAQWEYACRAGTTTAFNSGKNLNNVLEDDAMNEVGRYWYNGGQNYEQEDCDLTCGTAKVGSYLPNAWRLYDMHGNVTEYCLDSHSDDYGADAVTDPVGPSAGEYRVIRGGDGFGYALHCCSARRNKQHQMSKSVYTGFRIVCVP